MEDMYIRNIGPREILIGFGESIYILHKKSGKRKISVIEYKVGYERTDNTFGTQCNRCKGYDFRKSGWKCTYNRRFGFKWINGNLLKIHCPLKQILGDNKPSYSPYVRAIVTGSKLPSLFIISYVRKLII